MFTAGLTTSFKKQCFLRIHDFETDEIKIALYTSAATLGPSTEFYTPADEVSGVGYTPGGLVLPGVAVRDSEELEVGYVSFDDPIWNAATFSCRGALIYNATRDNRSIAVLNFGADQTMLSQQFKIQFPSNTPENALIRIA